jgi:hypothetical protein
MGNRVTNPPACPWRLSCAGTGANESRETERYPRRKETKPKRRAQGVGAAHSTNESGEPVPGDPEEGRGPPDRGNFGEKDGRNVGSFKSLGRNFEV